MSPSFDDSDVGGVDAPVGLVLDREFWVLGDEDLVALLPLKRLNARSSRVD